MSEGFEFLSMTELLNLEEAAFEAHLEKHGPEQGDEWVALVRALYRLARGKKVEPS